MPLCLHLMRYREMAHITHIALKTLVKACEVLDEYGADYEVIEVGFHGSMIHAKSARDNNKHYPIKIPREADKREVRAIVSQYGNYIASPDYL